MQRTISFIPGVSINYRVAENATDSNLWRLEIWKYSMIELKNYWLIGRGLAFDVKEAIAQLGVTVGQGGPYQAFHTHTYHSGPITLLIDFGIPGLITGLCFMIFALRKVINMGMRYSKVSLFEEQYFLFSCVNLVWLVFSFWFVFGDPKSLCTLILLVSHLMVLYNSLNIINKESLN